MANIYIESVKVHPSVDQLGGIAQELGQLAGDIDIVRGNLRSQMAGKAAIASSLQKVAEQIRREERSARSLGNGLEQILNLYNNTESRIRNNLLSHGNVSASQNHRETGAYHVDSIVFDDDGSYGGNQGNMDQVYRWDPIKCWDLLRDLREYFPNMSVFEAFRYFSRLNSVGCGYVALANTLFMEYANRPQDFERTFGYPMFKDGDLNYDRLILDIYATTDKAGFNDRDDGLPNGTVDDSRAHIVEHFLRDKGVDVETEANADVTPENFREISENGGYVILGYRHGNMYDENGNRYYIDGGHAITVTGITEDGRYIVSSWGEKYYINPSDIGDDDSFMVFNYNS